MVAAILPIENAGSDAANKRGDRNREVKQAAGAQETRHIDALSPHPDNPREELRENDPSIQDLAGSIIKNGVIEPLVINSKNQIYAGHRRRAASRVAYKRTGEEKFLHVPVVVSDAPPEAALEIMIAENKHRANLTPLEEARAMETVRDRKGLTAAALARELDLPPQIVSQTLSILKLAPEVQTLYHLNELPLSVAPRLSRVADRDKQISYAGLLARRQISVADFRKAVEKDLAPLDPDSPPIIGEPPGPTQPSLRAAPAPHAGPVKKRTKQHANLAAGTREHPTRAEAVAALGRVLSTKVSFVAVSKTLESLCCSCGMVDHSDVCRSCPLPRLILGLVGRADAPARPERRSRLDEEGED